MTLAANDNWQVKLSDQASSDPIGVGRPSSVVVADAVALVAGCRCGARQR